jgi:hypothetical protein
MHSQAEPTGKGSGPNNVFELRKTWLWRVIARAKTYVKVVRWLLYPEWR